jgi:hypothetical protein
MNISPSINEIKLTTVIFSVVVGLAAGILATTHVTTLVPAISTLVAAFIGAWTAYKLEDNKKSAWIKRHT